MTPFDASRYENIILKVAALRDNAWDKHKPDEYDDWLQVYDTLDLVIENLEEAYYLQREIL